MDKRSFGIIAIILGILIMVMILPDLKNGNSNSKEISSQDTQYLADQKSSENIVVMPENDIVQVYLFHATQRCKTCIAIGQLANETVNEYYQSELQAGRIEFREINIDLPENQALVKKFQASGSAFYINGYIQGEDKITEDVKVWRLTNDKEEFKSYLKGELDKLLDK